MDRKGSCVKRVSASTSMNSYPSLGVITLKEQRSWGMPARQSLKGTPMAELIDSASFQHSISLPKIVKASHDIVVPRRPTKRLTWDSKRGSILVINNRTIAKNLLLDRFFK